VRHVFHRTRSEDGQAVVIIVLFMMVMLGFCALCIDVGHAYLAQRRLQSSVDAAALAGAQELPNVASATSFAQSYGSGGSNTPDGVNNVQMTISTKCIASVPGCAPSNAVVVKESGNISTSFAKLFGIPSFTVHATATACSPCGEKPLDVMLVLDRTGSMCTDSAGKADPACTDMENARNGLKTFLSFMNPTLDNVGFAVLPPATSLAAACTKPPDSSSYDSPSSPYVLVPLSNDYSSNGVLNPASSLVSTINCVQANGFTAYANAIDAAQAELTAHGRPGTQKVIVFMSDGAANTGPLYYPASSPYLVTPCHQGMASAQAATVAGTSVYSIGYDVGHDRCQGEVKATQARSNEVPAITGLQALQGIASDPSQFYNQPDAAQLNTIFAAVANDILQGASRLIDDNAS
jgi:Putative Flp pilus-assembly TadE/G-like/von Willebrand factor type A domain